MNYEGQIAVIPLGVSGLFTDAAQSAIPATSLILANNVSFYDGVLEKDYGSRRWNTAALPSGIRRFGEMFPDNQGRNQRIYFLLEDGTIYRMPNNYTQQLVAAVDGAPGFLNPNNYTCMVVGGMESAGRARKAFFFTGYDPVQVVAGEEIVRRNISQPPADWSGTNQPFWALFHRGRLYAGGAPNNPHQVYASDAGNHENFQTDGLLFNVFPGEGDTIVGGATFRGRLFLFKYPLGVYYLVDTDADSDNWYFAKFTGDFGGCSPQGFLIHGDDLFVANNYGSITSMAAAFQFGDIAQSDLFLQFGIRRYTEDQIRPDEIFQRDMIYYGYKGQFFVSYQSFMNPFPDRMLSVDVRNKQTGPKFSFIDKDQPNCLGMLRDAIRVPRPFYGAKDGYLYAMDVKDRWVGASSGEDREAYMMDAQTPHMDFSQGNMLMGGQVKLYDFIQLEYEPTGDWPVNVMVYIDSRLMGTYPITLKGRSNLDMMPLTNSVVDGQVGFTDRIPVAGEGKRISLRFQQGGLGQSVRLVRAYIYYRMSGQQQTIG